MIDGPAAVAALEAAGFTHLVWLPDSHLGTWDAALSGSRLAPIRAARGLTPGGAPAVVRPARPRRDPLGGVTAMMTHREALEVLAARRGDRVVVTTMGSVALWPALSDTPRDFHYIPSSMGQGV